jgi:hypothetical protein
VIGRCGCGPSLPARVVSFVEAVGHEVVARVAGDRLPPEMMKRRRVICQGCPLRKGSVCGVCGCVITLKTRFVSEDCPEGKWPKLEEG